MISNKLYDNNRTKKSLWTSNSEFVIQYEHHRCDGFSHRKDYWIYCRPIQAAYFIYYNKAEQTIVDII